MSTEVYKVLAQVEVPAAALTLAYTVPALTSTVVSTLVICNRVAAARTFRISVAVLAAADVPMQYLFYGVSVPGGSSFSATIGITLAAGDVIRVYGSAAGLSLNVFGSEITP
jgi:hypothetical protein